MRPNMRPTEKTDPKGALNDLSAYMRRSLGVVILALVLAALSAVLTIIGPDQVGKIATLMSEGLVGGIDLAAVARVGVLLAVIYGLSALFGFIQHYIMASVTLKMSYRMRAELSEKINRVPQKYFNFHAQGDILSRITNDVSTLQQGLTNSLPTIISAATQFAGCLIMMFVTEWRLALAALGITLVGLLLTVLIMSRSQKYFTARQESLGALNGYVEEMYSGHEVVRISRAEALLRVLPRLAHRQVYLTAADAKDFYGLPARDVAAAMEELARQGILVRWREGYLPAQDVPLLQAQAFEPLRGVLALHRNDPLVRCGESARKERYKSPEKGSEVTQYLLVDGVIRGAVMGHFRYGPYDLHAVWLELPEQEAAVRRDEILRAVYAVNGPREEPPPFVPVG